jgi:tripartite-type tricarboxylate transporter receptor subunit TctC
MDFVARLLAQKIGESTKQNVIVENRTGASTNVGTEFVSRAAPDGYTVLLQAPNFATNEFAFKSLNWKREDFAPVALMIRWSNVLVAGPSAKVRDFRDLVSASKRTPGGFSYGSPGIGSLSHLSVEMLKAKTGAAMEHVPYNGVAPMLNNLLGKQIPYGVTNPSNFMSHLREGKLTPMVVFGSHRDPSLPDVPSLGDFGISGIEAYGWMGALVPAKTPTPVIARLRAELTKALRLPDVLEQLKARQLEAVGSSPEEFARFIQSENKAWGAAFRAAGIQPE